MLGIVVKKDSFRVKTATFVGRMLHLESIGQLKHQLELEREIHICYFYLQAKVTV